MDWLREKDEVVKQLKERELPEKREDRMAQQIQNELFMRQLQAQNEQTKIFQQQMLQQMQQQQQQFALLQHQMMQLMQQQAEAMSHLFKKD